MLNLCALHFRVRIPAPASWRVMPTKFEQAAAEFRIKSIIITMILSALGFLVALQWRDTIQETINRLIPPGEGLLYSYTVSIAITIGVVIVTYILLKVEKMDLVPEEKLKNHLNRIKKR